VNIRNLFVGALSLLALPATINVSRGDDCGPPVNGVVIHSNVVGQANPQYKITNNNVTTGIAAAAVTNAQPTNVVLAGGAVATPVVGQGAFVPVYSTSNYYSPGVYTNGLRYAGGLYGLNQPTGYAGYYAGYPGVINAEGNAFGVPQYYYPSSAVYTGRRMIRRW
jgi:hypothetical protein